MRTLSVKPLLASLLGLGSDLVRMGGRATKPSRRLLIKGEGDRGGDEDEADEKESSLWGMMRAMVAAGTAGSLADGWRWC